MNKSVKIKINNLEIEAQEGTTILEVAKDLGIDIPTLCYHEALGPYGSCRVCMVEIETPKGAKLTTACTYPVWGGLIVRTDSKKVKAAQKFAVELILARCPDEEEVKNLAQNLGIEKSRFKARKDKCILCGHCVRVCRDVIEKSAISFVGRGLERRVETPFDTRSEDCIGCGACFFLCPTGAISLEETKKVRKLHKNTEFELVGCKDCGCHFATRKELDNLKGKVDIPKELFEICPKCRRKKLRKKLKKESVHV